MWVVYIIQCADQTLYTGVTNNLEKRFAAHQAGTASKYTKTHKPVRIVYTEELPDRSSALKREAKIKKLAKSEKLKLVRN